jgi:A/G-specific adenine glycosylase
MRLLTRLYDYAEDISSKQAQQQLWQWAQALLPEERPGDANQAMMDLGRMICLPRNPLCAACPVKEHCLAFARQTQNLRPVKKAKAPLPTVRAAVAVIRDTTDRVLLVQRPPSGLLGGLWTLPGGQCAEEESFVECLQRSLSAEFGLRLRIGQEMAAAKQRFTHFHLLLRAYGCEVSPAKLKTLASKAQRKLAWASVAELDEFSFGKADREIINALSNGQPRLFEEG